MDKSSSPGCTSTVATCIGHRRVYCPVREKCKCNRSHMIGKCQERDNATTEEFHHNNLKIHGAPIPEELIELLKDPHVIKAQSNIVGLAKAPGDIDKLQKMLDISIPSFLEIQNLVHVRFPTEAKCGMDSLQALMQLMPGSKALREEGRKCWQSPRGFPWTMWSSRMVYYDAADVMTPALFLLYLGKEMMTLEHTSDEANALPYIRELCLQYLNEPSHLCPNTFRYRPCTHEYLQWECHPDRAPESEDNLGLGIRGARA